MLLKFPYVEEEKKPEIVTKQTEKKRDDNDSFRYKVNNLDNRTVLSDLSGTSFVG
jgi:hypothetical protein